MLIFKREDYLQEYIEQEWEEGYIFAERCF